MENKNTEKIKTRQPRKTTIYKYGKHDNREKINKNTTREKHIYICCMGNKTTENKINKHKTREKQLYYSGKQDNSETNKNKAAEKTTNVYIYVH